jgi:hypothetical protein
MKKLNSIRRRGAVMLMLVVACSIVFAIGAGSGGARSLSSHCTEYAPSLQPVDTNCGLYGTMAGSGYYQTPSTALRDYNQELTYAARGLKVWYPSTSISATANGTYVEIQSSGSTYVYADCEITSGGSVTGYCETTWHN